MKKIVVLGALAACIAAPSVAHAKVYGQLQTGIDHVSVGGLSDDGFSIGGALGYEHMLGKKAFAAIELTVDGSTAELCDPNLVFAGDNGCMDSRGDSSLVVKLGTALSAKADAYVLGGSAYREFRYFNNGANPFTDIVELDGWRAGAGVKLKISGKKFVKIEYRYSDYEAGFTSSSGLVAVGTAF